MHRAIRLAAIVWLVFVFGFGLGIYIHATEHWPYPLVEEFQAFVAGHQEEQTGLVEKISNDLNITPARHIADLNQPFPVPDHYRPLAGLPLSDRRDEPLVFFSDQAPRGYRVIHATFDFDDAYHGVVLLDPDGQVQRVWRISQEGVDWQHRPDRNIVPHGFVIGRDGSVVVAFDGGTSLTRYDYCGRVEWRAMGGFHHSVDLGDDGVLWSWGRAGHPYPWGSNLIKVDFDTGEVLGEFHVTDIRKANPDIDIFGIRQDDNAEGSKWQQDRWHVNDIDPLPASLAQYYPGFEAGDLLVSFRSVNLVFVVDPESLAVKWWRQGLTRRQHDPDWNAEGSISVFDNNMHRGYSRIVEIDPATMEHRTLLAGKRHEFYTWRRGKHQRMADGGLLVTSTEQGRVFEVDADGNLRFEFLNTFRHGESYLTVSEARFLPPDFFDALPDCNP